MGPQPAPQQRPEPFEGVDVDLAEPVPVVIRVDPQFLGDLLVENKG